MGILSLAFTAVSAVGGAIAAIAAWRATSETRRAAQAQLVASLRGDYARPEMLAATVRVRDWNYGSPITPDGDIDRARRSVSHHFQRIVILANAGLLDEQFLPVVVTKDEADLFCGQIQEMERQLNEGYDRTAFERLDRLYSGHPDGNVRRLIR